MFSRSSSLTATWHSAAQHSRGQSGWGMQGCVRTGTKELLRQRAASAAAASAAAKARRAVVQLPAWAHLLLIGLADGSVHLPRECTVGCSEA